MALPRILLAAVFALLLTVPAVAQCPGGVCRKPVRTAIAAIPTLAPARPHSPVLKRGQERSVVVRRGFRNRGPGLWARITFRPGR